MLDASQISKDPVANLQLGLAIELAVLPPYLYALWSLKTKAEGAVDATVEAARTIRAVVYEEMLHAALVGNDQRARRIAQGAAPADALPRARCPATPRPTSPARAACPWSGSRRAPRRPSWGSSARSGTRRSRRKPGTWANDRRPVPRDREGRSRREPAFNGHRAAAARRQPGPGKLVQVQGPRTALEAIETIVDQGEGHRGGAATRLRPARRTTTTTRSPTTTSSSRSATTSTRQAHRPRQTCGRSIRNPKASEYSAAQQPANKAFNVAYSALLDSLQAMFTPPRLASTASRPTG